jgi:hypothetical protein
MGKIALTLLTSLDTSRRGMTPQETGGQSSE